MNPSSMKARLFLVMTMFSALVANPPPLAGQICGEADAPVCDGECPPDQACVPGGPGCMCVPTGIPCGFLQGGPACHGYCPAGFPICVVGIDLECLCVPAFTPTPTPTSTETPTPTLTTRVTPTLATSPEPTATLSPTSTVFVGTFTPTPVPCVGDCDRNRQVTVDEIVRAVNIALGNSFISTCRAVDADGDGEVTVDEIVRAVNSALHGCG